MLTGPPGDLNDLVTAGDLSIVDGPLYLPGFTGWMFAYVQVTAAAPVTAWDTGAWTVDPYRTPDAVMFDSDPNGAYEVLVPGAVEEGCFDVVLIDHADAFHSGVDRIFSIVIVHPDSSETTLVANMAEIEPSLATVEIPGGAVGDVYLRTADSVALWWSECQSSAVTLAGLEAQGGGGSDWPVLLLGVLLLASGGLLGLRRWSRKNVRVRL